MYAGRSYNTGQPIKMIYRKWKYLLEQMWLEVEPVRVCIFKFVHFLMIQR